MLIPVAWYYFSEIFRSYSINHHSHQDMFIDNPALQLTRDWIFDLKKGIKLYVARLSVHGS